MADDISKTITIGVELETEKVTQNINSLNNVIDTLLAKQQQLNATGQQNSAAFNTITTQLQSFREKLQSVNTQLSTGASALNALTAAGKSLGTSISSATSQHEKNAKAIADNSAKTKELTQQVNSFNPVAKQQKANVDEVQNAMDNFSVSISKASSGAGRLQGNIAKSTTAFDKSTGIVNTSRSSFDAHKATMDLLKTSFDEIKDVSGIFGPSLQQAAKGFNLMRSGLNVVKDGLTGVGAAIKADGFEFLLQILQSLFNYFVNTSQGTQKLQGAISAIGVVVNKVTGFFHSFMDGVINAFSHPIDTLKSLGKMIEQNLINRFTAFAVILDGIIHLDFKKVANGAIQAFTGVTNATDKISKGFTAVKDGLQGTVKEIGAAYTKGYNEAGKKEDDHHEKVMKHLGQESKAVAELNKNRAKSGFKSKGDTKNENTSDRGALLDDPHKINDIDLTNDTSGAQPGISKIEIQATQKIQDEETKLQKAALQQVEDYAKQSGVRIANDALNTLSNSIKQQTSAKIAALEKDKTNELNNKNLTSAQKLAIQQKYQQQENAIKTKAFKEEQELSIAQAIINGAQAITKVWAQGGLLGAFETGVVIAETAAQVAKIASQKPPAYAKGGLHYSSDGRGGILAGYSRTDNTNAYLRLGEGIVVSEAMRVPWARNLVSAINVGFGGRDFSTINTGRGYAVGGIFTDGGDANRYYNQPVNDQKNLANTIAYQMINNFPPVYVDVKDINNQQNILAQTINRVNL